MHSDRHAVDRGAAIQFHAALVGTPGERAAGQVEPAEQVGYRHILQIGRSRHLDRLDIHFTLQRQFQPNPGRREATDPTRLLAELADERERRAVDQRQLIGDRAGDDESDLAHDPIAGNIVDLETAFAHRQRANHRLAEGQLEGPSGQADGADRARDRHQRRQVVDLDVLEAELQFDGAIGQRSLRYRLRRQPHPELRVRDFARANPRCHPFAGILGQRSRPIPG